MLLVVVSCVVLLTFFSNICLQFLVFFVFFVFHICVLFFGFFFHVVPEVFVVRVRG